MKTMMKIVAAMLIAVMLLSTVAFAESYVKFTKNGIGYKKAGSGKTGIIIRKGSVACVEKKGDAWTRVTLDQNTSLWFKNDCLKKTKDSGAVIYSAGGEGKSNVYEGAEPESYKKGCKKVLASGRCNIRKKPCLSGKDVGTLKKGETLKCQGVRRVDSRGVYWYKVKYNGGTAWVSSVYTKPVK